MNKSSIYAILMTVLALFLLVACGDGGGNNKKSSSKSGAMISLATAGNLPAATLIGGIEITLLLPPGVTVEVDADEENPGKMVVGGAGLTLPEGAAESLVVATYRAATDEDQARVSMVIANADGFATGKFVTVNCQLNGTSPAADSFSLDESSFKVYGTDSVGNSTTEITAELAPVIEVAFN